MYEWLPAQAVRVEVGWGNCHGLIDVWFVLVGGVSTLWYRSGTHFVFRDSVSQ